MNREAIKGVVYRKEDVTIGGKVLQKYILAVTVVTDVDLGLDFKENVIFSEGSAILSTVVKDSKKYAPPYPLGQIQNALQTVPNIELDEFIEK